jgi:NAD(P)-dependent dehydrogenase (short-subunit alcohol dehydrogenase family)
VVLIDELLLAKKLKNTALYVSSEVVRGVKKMGMKRPNLKTSSVDEFASIFDGSYFGEKMDVMEAYGLVKYAATLWMSSIARVHKNIRFISISPGATTGTDAASSSNMSFIMRFIYKHILMPMMGHKLEDGAKRFVDGIHDESLKSGIFYASKEKALTGPVVDQSTIFSDLKNESFQDNASEAIHRFIK